MNATRLNWWKVNIVNDFSSVNIGSGKGLVPSGHVASQGHNDLMAPKDLFSKGIVNKGSKTNNITSTKQSTFAYFMPHCKISNISGHQILNDSHLTLQLSLPNPLKPGV